ncbi:hypothetical protein N7478_005031 [Penicillium angulare]|uniref:uncharacterized protein n=1 Tax=Penicillium angulare TaxID=116970 RepID=UPI002541B804|nr:uncharacterized protein N7478_005031 [Penicillium angulare]KAJ5279659.1 hypothetical protein N7478_005031 [Penicillium angulare]
MFTLNPPSKQKSSISFITLDQSIPEESPIYSFSGEFMQWSPPPQVPSPNSDQPFLGAPDLSPCSQNRIWTSRYKPTDDQSFEVWRDPFSVFAQLSPRANTPESIREPEEDKENIFATSSDYEFPREQEEEGMNIDFDALHNHRLDAFGAPFAIPFARPLAERSVNDDGSLGHHVHAIHFPVPTETVRPAMRIRFHEEEDGLNGHWDDWGDVLERGQTRDLATLSDQYARGVEQRENNGRQYPMRDDLNI